MSVPVEWKRYYPERPSDVRTYLNVLCARFRTIKQLGATSTRPQIDMYLCMSWEKKAKPPSTNHTRNKQYTPSNWPFRYFQTKLSVFVSIFEWVIKTTHTTANRVRVQNLFICQNTTKQQKKSQIKQQHHVIFQWNQLINNLFSTVHRIQNFPIHLNSVCIENEN